MQVILVKPVRKLGKVGETVTVANGYGRNYLIPQEFAIRTTTENLAKFASLQKELEAKNSENKENAEKAAKLIEGKHIDFVTQSAADGRLFGSVNARALAIEVSKFVGITLNYTNILLDAPIKFNGVYNIQIILHPEVVTNILVVIAKSAAEAQDALREHKEGSSKKTDEAKEEELLALEAESDQSAIIEEAQDTDPAV